MTLTIRGFVEYFLVEFVIFNEILEIHYIIEMHDSYIKVRLISHFYEFFHLHFNKISNNK